MKLPRSWPNSSLSIRVGEMAPQFTGRNGFLLRRLRAWIVCADHLLAGARLPGEEDAGVGAGHAADQVVDLLHGR